MNVILKEDIESFTLPPELTNELSGSSILVTGATGLIGSMLVKCLNALNIGIKFILLVRNIIKAETMFKDISANVSIFELTQDHIPYNLKCDYIIHCASPTNGAYITTHPVETFNMAVRTTESLLEYCKEHHVKGIVYLSSIEYYGQIFNDDPVNEEMIGHIDHRSARNSYALGKQAAEYLIYAYAEEYGLPCKTARLTQTFGAGISQEDKRVFAQFARSVVKGEKIVLHTKGESAKPYCYITDCITALIYILLKGKKGEAYNVATPNTYVSIRRLAEMFAVFAGDKDVIEYDLTLNHGYAPETRINMDSTKLMDLGWLPRYSLNEMIGRIIKYVRTSELGDS